MELYCQCLSMESTKSIYLFMMEVQPQCRKFVLIKSRWHFQYTQYKCLMTSSKLTKIKWRYNNSSKNIKVSRLGNRLYSWYQVPQVLSKDDIPITTSTDHLWICLWNADEDRGVIGRRHKIFSNIRSYIVDDNIQVIFFSNEYSLYRNS